MQELITRLTEKAGITTEQANKSLEAITDFIKEKFPMMAGAVDNLFASEMEPTASIGDTSAVLDPEAPSIAQLTFMDKISDVIPGQAGEKVENFVKGAADKAEDVYDNVKEKLGNMFGGDKK